MPDSPDPQQTPGQVLAGSPPPQQTPPQQQQAPPPPDASNMPLNARQGPGMAPSGFPQQPPQPTPQQLKQAAVDQHHKELGKVTSFLFGQQIDADTGQKKPETPGSVLRSLLAGALLGASAGLKAGKEGQGILGGIAAGGVAGMQARDDRDQQNRDQAEKKKQLSLEEQRAQDEHLLHAATLEHWNLESLARSRESDFRDREQLEKEEVQDENIQKWSIENGAQIASIPGNATPGNGPKLMRDMVNNPDSFKAPEGYGRLIVKHYDFDGLDHDSKNGWSENGRPVDWNKHMTWSIYFAPTNTTNTKPVTMSGRDLEKNYDIKGLDPDRDYTIDGGAKSLIAAATTQRKKERESNNQDFKEKHDALTATIQSARTNVTQLADEKRALLRQGYAEDDDEVKGVETKIEAEQKREQDAIAEMHPRIRERVKAPAPPRPKPIAAPPAAPKTHSFSVKAWVKANPSGNLDQAKALAQKNGYTVVE